MGSCASISKRNKNQLSIVRNPAFTLDLKSSSIFKLDLSGNIEKINLSLAETIPTDCAFGFIDQNTLIIIGGSDSSNSLRNEVFRVNFSEFTIEYLPNLPFNSKYGEIHYYNNYIYYLGGVRFFNNNSYPTPFLRLSNTSSFWEILEEKPRTGKNLMVTSQLYRAGSFLLKNSIFLVGGEIMIPNYVKSYNKSVFKLDLDTLSVNSLNIIGVCCSGPQCFPINNDIIVMGVSEASMNFIQKIGENMSSAKDLGFKFSPHKKLQSFDGDFSILTPSKLKRLRPDKLTWKIDQISPEKIKSLGLLSNILNHKPRSEAPKKILLISNYYDENCKQENEFP